MLGLQMEHAWDDIDLGELASPARPGSHRRSRSDPSEMLQAIREERHAAGDAAQMRPKWDAEGANDGAQAVEVVPKRDLSPAKATGFSPAMKKHASIQPSHHQRTSLLPPAFDFADGAGDLEAGVGSSGEGGAGDEDEAAELVIMPPPVNFPLAGGLVVPSAEDFEAAAGGEKAPKNYSKKDVPMWTVEEDLLILKLVEQVRHHSRQGPKMNASASAHQPPPACAAPFNPLRASWVGVDKCAGPASGRGGPIARARTHTSSLQRAHHVPSSFARSGLSWLQHGKRWSKIASHLPGRTDNGVRNRWNRMERAQVLKQRRGPAAGYRCRRCGEPKRGHICAARTMGEQPEGEELSMKASAAAAPHRNPTFTPP